jgi:uncharacterized protein YkwD
LRLSLTLLILLVANSPADDFDLLREEFLEQINAARAREGRAPLSLSAPLARVAQQFAEESARRGDIATVDQTEVVARAEKAGYSPKAMAEVFTRADGSVEEVTGFLREHGGATWRSLMGEGLRDLGVGVAVIDDVPVYVFLLGVSWEEYAAGRSKEYRDLGAMRRQMLARVNAERRRRGLPAMVENLARTGSHRRTRTTCSNAPTTDTRVRKASRCPSGRSRAAIECVLSARTSRAASRPSIR